MKITRAHLEWWVGVIIRKTTSLNFSWVAQSSKVTPVVEKEGNASPAVNSELLMFTSCSKSPCFVCRGSQDRIVFLCFSTFAVYFVFALF